MTLLEKVWKEIYALIGLVGPGQSCMTPGTVCSGGASCLQGLCSCAPGYFPQAGICSPWQQTLAPIYPTVPPGPVFVRKCVPMIHHSPNLVRPGDPCDDRCAYSPCLQNCGYGSACANGICTCPQGMINSAGVCVPALDPFVSIFHFFKSVLNRSPPDLRQQSRCSGSQDPATIVM